MTVQEIHIEIDLALQNINSNVRDTLKPEEKDWLFNLAQLRFIKNRTNPKSNPKKEGFLDTVKRYQDLDVLITSRSIPLYYLDDNSVYALMPQNCYEVIEQSGIRPLVTRTDCGNNFSQFVLQAKPIYKSVCKFPILTLGTSYANFVVKKDGVIIFSLANYPQYSTGVVDTDLRYEIINKILVECNKINDLEVRWENFNKNFYDYSLIFSSSSAFNNITFEWTGGGSQVNNQAPETLQAYVIPTQGTETATRLVETSDVWNINSHAFWATKYSSPVVYLENRTIVVTHLKKFISNTLKIDYIRKPRKISLSLNQGSDFEDNRISEIVTDMATDLQARINAGTYKNLLNQELLKE